MTLDEALKIYGLEMDGLTNDVLKKRFRELAKSTHPDANLGVDNGFNKISLAYDVINRYLNKDLFSETESYNENISSRYFIIYVFLISSDILGLDDNDDSRVANIYSKLGMILNDEDNENDIDEYIKNAIIEIFKIKYHKSFKALNILNPDKYFSKLGSTDTSIDDVYLDLSYKYNSYVELYFRQYYFLAKNYLKNEQDIVVIINSYIMSLLRDGTIGNTMDFINFMKKECSYESTESLEDIDDINISSIVPISIDNSSDNSATSFRENDIVYSNFLGPLQLGIIVSENNQLVVKYYIYARDDDKILTGRFNPHVWHKLDDFIDKGYLTRLKVIKNCLGRIVIDKNVLIYNDGYYLIANGDYSKFGVTSELIRESEYRNSHVISMWPDFVSKESIRKAVSEDVVKKCLPDEYSRIHSNLPVVDDKSLEFKKVKKY